MAGLEELKKKLVPLFDAEKGFSSGSTLDPSDSYVLSDGGTVNLLSQSYGVYNISELGLQKCPSWPIDDTDHTEKTYREMRIFGAIGSGASSVVQRAIHIPSHRIIALKKINIFEKNRNKKKKKQQVDRKIGISRRCSKWRKRKNIKKKIKEDKAQTKKLEEKDEEK